jgi:hypothetical protein
MSVIFAGVLTWTLRHHAVPVPAALQRVPGPPLIPMAAADMPAGLDGTVRQLSDLLEAGDAEQALRLCWAPSNLEQMGRSGLFAKCAELVKENAKLPPTLQRILAVGPTKTFKTQEGLYCAEFNENATELTSMRFVYVNNHWYVW